MIGALQRCSNSEDHVMNTQCREGSKTSAAVYAPLEGDIESVPVSEASHPSIMISGRPPAVEDSTCQLSVALMLGSYPWLYLRPTAQSHSSASSHPSTEEVSAAHLEAESKRHASVLLDHLGF
jgi:hypothetical protein